MHNSEVLGKHPELSGVKIHEEPRCTKKMHDERTVRPMFFKEKRTSLAQFGRALRRRIIGVTRGTRHGTPGRPTQTYRHLKEDVTE